jgi:hypothetical protein
MLNKQLKYWEYTFVDADGTEGDLNLKQAGRGQYVIQKGADNRKDFLRYRKDGDGHKAGDPFLKTDPNFNGVILP